MNILIAADGSPHTRRAARYVAEHLRDYGKAPRIHVLHVHPKLPYPGVATVIGAQAVERYQREESEKAIAVASKQLPPGKVRCTTAWVVGDVASEVKAYVRRHKIDQVVMGSHGRGAFAGLALGSTATKIIAAVKVPVLVVP